MYVATSKLEEKATLQCQRAFLERMICDILHQELLAENASSDVSFKKHLLNLVTRLPNFLECTIFTLSPIFVSKDISNGKIPREPAHFYRKKLDLR